MNYQGIEIVCPVCKGELKQKPAAFWCESCNREYPVLHEIPDFRIFPDPYIDIPSDREKGGRLAEKFQELSFSELVHYYYSITPAVPSHLARRYATSVISASARAKATLDLWSRSGAGTDTSSLRFLDIGCGTAPLLVAAASRFQQVAGVDISFRWLTVARKRLLESGMKIPLFCACAEALPFPDRSFNWVGSESAIEHMKDQNQMLSECKRILTIPGRICLSTPNRWSLGPDPQTGIPAGGWLPDRWTGSIVLKKGGLPPQRKLLSANDLRKLLQNSGFANVRTFLPEIPADQQKQFGAGTQFLIRAYNSGRNFPLMRSFLLQFGPIFHMIAFREDQ